MASSSFFFNALLLFLFFFFINWGRVDWQRGISSRCTARGFSFICIYTHTYACLLSHRQLCPGLRNPMDHSPPDSFVHRFSRQEPWSGLPCPSPGALPHPRDQTCISYACVYTHTYIYTYNVYPKSLFPFTLLQKIDSILCHTGGPSCLSILCTVVSVC